MRRAFPILLLPVCLLLTACAATPYRQPATACSQSAGASSPDDWWQGFSDPLLLSLLSEVSQCNVDLTRQVLALRSNRLEEGRSDLQPQGGLAVTGSAPLKGGDSTRNHAVTTSVSYELDVWGKLERGHEADAWLSQASAADLRALRLSLQAETAATYWQLASLQYQRELQRERIGLAERLLQLESQAVALGAAAPRDARERRQALLADISVQEQLAAQAQRLREHLAALLDQPALSPLVPMHGGSDATILPPIRSGLPADLLSRRPDVAAAEARLRRKLALYDQARASLLPGLSLTGSMGASSGALRQWLLQPWASLAGSLTLPFLNGHNLAIARDQAQLDADAEAETYRRVVNRALREVDDGLSSRQRLQEDAVRMETSLALARQTEAEAVLRWKLGDVDRRLPLEARMYRLQLEQQLAWVRMEQKINLAILFKVMGGAPAPRG